MLAKLRFFRSGGVGDIARLRALIEPDLWADALDAKPGSFLPLPGGTLNTAFAGRAANERTLCVKTHLLEAGRSSLCREAAYLQALYGETVAARLVTTKDRDWLVMNMLAPLASSDHEAVRPDWIDGLIETVPSGPRAEKTLETFDDVAAAAREALAFLTEQGHVSSSAAKAIAGRLDRLAETTADLEPRLCHGDLGPRNVMRDGTDLVLLDWEDSFLGVAGYDWIYWLSFFQNRPRLSSASLQRSGLSIETSCAILLVILLVKCEMSVRSGTASGNRLSCEQRLAEALSI